MELNDGTKARFWDRMDKFPPGFAQLGLAVAAAAARASTVLAEPCGAFEPRVGALNFYTGRGRMGWHADDYNFAKKERPIVMASVGDACDFGYKLASQDPERFVRLDSGDCLVFGGPARDLIH